jgi:hypothetical protein
VCVCRDLKIVCVFDPGVISMESVITQVVEDDS